MIEIKPGDVFAVNSESVLSKTINAVSGWNSSDGVSNYNHAGIITSSSGDTFEALWKLGQYNLDHYKGRRIVIARPNSDMKTMLQAIQAVIKKHEGQWYPFWRLALHLYPPLARSVSYKGKYTVCSESVAEYEFLAKVRHEKFAGVSPDMLVDEWRKWKDFDIIYEGIWPE